MHYILSNPQVKKLLKMVLIIVKQGSKEQAIEKIEKLIEVGNL